jgi:hypothetical protein
VVWQPTRFRRFETCIKGSSTGPAVVVTDAGQAYVKALGNPEGPHVLACEWIAANLARWLGLRTFDFAIFSLRRDDCVPLSRGRRAEPGPVFATRAERGNPWNGTADELVQVTNKADLSRLIVFDTWIRNRDRYVAGRRCHVDNVFLSAENTPGAARELVAMDHTHCLADGTELTPRLAHVACVRDEGVFGAFPAFAAHWSEAETAGALMRLAAFRPDEARRAVAGVPREWQVTEDTREALVRFLSERANWLSTQAPSLFRPQPGL